MTSQRPLSHPFVAMPQSERGKPSTLVCVESSIALRSCAKIARIVTPRF